VESWVFLTIDRRGSVVTVGGKVRERLKMEIYIDVWVEDRELGIRTKANEAILHVCSGE
jgi:acyl-CoA hydrolase